MRSHWVQGDESFPHASCEERARVCSARKLQLHANEYVLPPGGGRPAAVCQEFVNLVILRNPVSRCVSNVMHLHQMFIWNNASNRFPTTFEGIAKLAPRVVNNMYTRTLLGQRAFKLPYDAITEQHLQAAKLKLLQFDVLLLLEEPDKADVLLQRMLGWKDVRWCACACASSCLSLVFKGHLSFVTWLPCRCTCLSARPTRSWALCLRCWAQRPLRGLRKPLCCR